MWPFLTNHSQSKQEVKKTDQWEVVQFCTLLFPQWCHIMTSHHSNSLYKQGQIGRTVIDAIGTAVSGSPVVILSSSYYVQFCGQHLKHGNILPFLFNFLSYVLPAVGGPRLYGTRQVGLRLFTLGSQWPVWPVTVTQKANQRCLSPSWAANLQQNPCPGLARSECLQISDYW